MRRPGLGGAFWPTDEEEELLRVALGLASVASSGWDTFHSKLDVDALGADQHRLLPLLWRRLSSQGVESPVVARLRGFYRRSWYRNSLLLAEVSSVAAALAREGIDVLALKGAAVALLYYQDHACRPMNDIDLLVRPWQARQSVQALLDMGWTYEGAVPQDAVFDWLSRVELRNRRGLVLDLHWDFLSDYLIPGWSSPTIDDAWASSRECPTVPDELGRVQLVRALEPEAQLLHTIAHGARWAPGSRLQWIADTTRIVESSGGILDWDRLVGLATCARRGRILGDALSYLSSQGFARVPPGIVRTLQGPGRARPAADWLRGRGFPRVLGGTPLIAAGYLDLRGQMPDTAGLPPPRPFLRAVWNLAPTESIPASIPSKVATIVRRAFGGRQRGAA